MALSRSRELKAVAFMRFTRHQSKEQAGEFVSSIQNMISHVDVPWLSVCGKILGIFSEKNLSVETTSINKDDCKDKYYNNVHAL